jgi:predicted dinucleotide-binding enzyme
MFGSRDLDKARQTGSEIGAQGGSYAQAATFGDVLLLSTPWDKTEDILRDLGALDGKIIIETTNNFTDHDNPRSNTERIMAWTPGAKVVKAFNTVFQQIIHTDSAAAKDRPSVFMAGDDTDAKQIVAQLIIDAGFDAVDVGPARNAKHVENLALAIIEFAYGQGMGTSVSFKLIKVV